MGLESLDSFGDNLVINITAERNGEVINISLSAEETVPPNSLWRASILAYGCERDRVLTDYELSKLTLKMNFRTMITLLTIHQ